MYPTRQDLIKTNHIFFQYMRDERRNPIGCAVVIYDNGVANIGWSKYNQSKETKRFDKDTAVFKAFQRASAGIQLDTYPDCMRNFMAHITEKTFHKYNAKEIFVK